MKTTVPLVGFLPTAFTPNDDIAEGLIEDAASRMARHGVRPAVLGGMGEFYSLSAEEAGRVINAAVAGSAGLVPTVCGIGFATREAEELARKAADAGASMLVINPHYFAYPRPQGFAEHVRRVTEASGLPAVVYSSPHMPVTMAHLERLCAVQGFIGVKETAVPLEDLGRWTSEWGDRVQWWIVGEVAGCEAVRTGGANGITSSYANVDPRGSAQYVVANAPGSRMSTDDGSLSRLGELRERIDAWHALLAEASEGYLGVLKAAAAEMFSWEPLVRAPMENPSVQTRQLVADFLSKYGLNQGQEVETRQ